MCIVPYKKSGNGNMRHPARRPVRREAGKRPPRGACLVAIRTISGTLGGRPAIYIRSVRKPNARPAGSQAAHMPLPAFYRHNPCHFFLSPMSSACTSTISFIKDNMHAGEWGSSEKKAKQQHPGERIHTICIHIMYHERTHN